MKEPAIAYARAISEAIRGADVPGGQIVDVIMALFAVAAELAKSADVLKPGYIRAAAEAFDWSGSVGQPN